ncbi:PTS sugar transporter subunit IIC [Metabacillus sp. GX 13764]|uniref:PTS sugar transporter subunit IIC n=1 Tax=Metabacillus kandeliae TaxID=2900151 RepID=UPI001E419553|nr:PTS sugar transporter subunit IIC [Metabacillus kandeliae]MCD7035059.1 PTS sugar transporter subunit IIC [Metabacillus kandeliae]
MSFMAKFESSMERVLVPLATKLNSQRHLGAIRDAFILLFPITMAGSLIVLLNFAILSPDGFIAKILFLPSLFPHLADAQAIFTPVLRGSLDIMAIFIAYLVGRNMALAMKADDLLCGLTSVSCYFIIYTPYRIIENQAFLTNKWLGPQGLFVALLVGLVVGELFGRLSRSKRLQLTLPPQVPPAITRSFKVLFPIVIVTVAFAVLSYLISLAAPNGLHELVYKVLQSPLKEMGTNVWTVIFLGIVANFLWIFGIHGPNTIAAIRETIFTEANLDNLNFVAKHGTAWGAPYPETWTLTDAFANYGGSGMTLGLLIAIFIASRRKEYKELGKLALAPGIFNINEPIIFGLPIVLNPLFIIPFILVPAINTFVGYLFIALKIIPPVAYAVPWTTPGPLIPFLGTGGNWMGLVAGFVCLAISTVVYLPFVMAANKAAAMTDEKKA